MENDGYRDVIQPAVDKLFEFAWTDRQEGPSREEVYAELRELYIAGYEAGDDDGYDDGCMELGE